MSDSSSEEVVAAPKAKVKAAVVMDDSDDSKEVPKAGEPKKKAAAAAPAFETDSEDESAPARPAPKAKAVVDSDSSDGEQAPATIKIAQKAKVIQAGSDDSDSDAGVAPAKADKTAQKSEGKEPAKKSKGESKQDAGRSATEKKGEKDVDGLRVYIAGIPWKVTEEELTKDFSKCGDIKNAKILTDDQERSKGMAFITFRTAEGTKRALARDGDSEKYPGRTIKVALANKTTGKDGKDPRESKKEAAEAQRKADRVKGLVDVSALEDGDIFNMNIIKKMLHAQVQKDFTVLESLGMSLAQRARIAKGEKKKKQETRQKYTVFVKGLPSTDFDESAFRQRFEDCGKIKFLWMPRKKDGELKGFGTLMFKDNEAFQKALKYDGTKCKDNKLTVVPSKPKEERGEEDGKTPKKEKKPKEDKAAEAVEKTAKRKAGDEGKEPHNDKQERKKQKLAQEEAAENLPRKEKKSKATEAPVEEVVVKKKKKEAA